MADAKKKTDNPLDGVQKWWRGQSQNNKLLIGGGGALLLLFIIAALAGGGSNNNIAYGPNGYQGQGYPGGYQGQDGGQGYANYGSPGQAGGAYGTNGGGQTDEDPNGYWARQRTQEQAARAYSDHIRDNNTVQNNQTGEVYTDVPNTVADPAIAGGGYTQVPTAELPTTTPAPAETPAE